MAIVGVDMTPSIPLACGFSRISHWGASATMRGEGT
jgi:hypothetical protein